MLQRIGEGEEAGGRVADAMRAIGRLIRDEGLMPGDRLPSEGALARDLAVSRSVVREAFRALAAMRVLDLAPGKRAAVARLDPGAMSLMLEHGVHTDQIGIQQIYDVRRTVEARIAQLAAIRRSEAEAEGLRAAARAMREAVAEPALLMERDIAFHAALARACRNPAFALLVGAFEGVTRRSWPVGWRARTTPEARERMIAGHEDIARAVAAGDPAAAAAAMGRHFDESLRALLEAGLS